MPKTKKNTDCDNFVLDAAEDVPRAAKRERKRPNEGLHKCSVCSFSSLLKDRVDKHAKRVHGGEFRVIFPGSDLYPVFSCRAHPNLNFGRRTDPQPYRPV